MPRSSTTQAPQRVVPTFNYPSYPASTVAAPTRGSSYDPFTFQTSSSDEQEAYDEQTGTVATTNVDVMVSGTTEASMEDVTDLEKVTTGNVGNSRVRSPKRKRKTQPFKRNMLMNIILRPGNLFILLTWLVQLILVVHTFTVMYLLFCIIWW